MPEVNQVFFSHKEIAELLIKKADIHDGKWVLTVNFGFSTGNFGPVPEQMSPGAIVALLGIGLTRAVPEAPDAVKVDAAIVNPGPAKPQSAEPMKPRRKS
jgi:hypothetical protein